MTIKPANVMDRYRKGQTRRLGEILAEMEPEKNNPMTAYGQPSSATSDEREILARTLMAEAGNQGLEGMLAAGAVIKNRVSSGRYGQGLEGVIMKPGQFSAWNSVTGYAGGEQGQDMENIRPSREAYEAADLLLSGRYQDPTGGATHYYNPSVSTPKWGKDGDWKRIGAHIFGNPDGEPGRTNPMNTYLTGA